MKKAKKLLAFLLSFIFILSLPTPVAAASSLWHNKPTSMALEHFDLTENLIEKVQEDLLLGQISNHEATISLAIAQYLNLVSEGIPQVDNGGLPQIAQVISNKEASDGSTERAVAYSTLVILDKNGNAITSEELVDMSMQADGTLDGYSIDASHTTYFTLKVDTWGRITAARLDRMTTVLTYNSSSTASKLVQVYVADPAPFQTEYFETSRTINSPSARTTYTYRPGGVFYPTNLYGTSIGSRAEVYCGSKVLVVRSTYPLD